MKKIHDNSGLSAKPYPRIKEVHTTHWERYDVEVYCNQDKRSSIQGI